VSSAAVSEEDGDTDGEREAGHAEDEELGPGLGVGCPRGEGVLAREGLGGVEDGEGGGDHGEDDEGAAEVDTSKGKLGHPDAHLDFLWFTCVSDQSSGFPWQAGSMLTKGERSAGRGITRSFFCFFDVSFSLLSSRSSRKVGLSGLLSLPGVPGTLRALLRGVMGTVFSEM
jgi:hypothetical protein